MTEIDFSPREFMGIRAFRLWHGELLRSLTAKGGQYSNNPYIYYKPTAWIPPHVFNKGIHYGFQSFKVGGNVEYFMYSQPILGLVQHYGTVREFEDTYVSSHMIIRELYVYPRLLLNYFDMLRWFKDSGKYTRNIKIHLEKMKQRYQCDVLVDAPNILSSCRGRGVI